MIEQTPSLDLTPRHAVGTPRYEIIDVTSSTATVNFYRNEELILTKEIAIPAEANGDINHPTFQTYLKNIERVAKFNALKIGVRAPTVERP